MIIVLNNHRPPSWNQFYQGGHWSYRHKITEKIHLLVKANILDDKLFTAKVHITVIAYFNFRLLDPDNIPAKIYIDALKGIIIEDDTPHYIGSVTTISKKDIQYPRVEIHIEERR